MGNSLTELNIFLLTIHELFVGLDFKIVNFFYKFSSYLKLINSYSEIAWIMTEVFYERGCK
jgi:hypothetical protein